MSISLSHADYNIHAYSINIPLLKVIREDIYPCVLGFVVISMPLSCYIHAALNYCMSDEVLNVHHIEPSFYKVPTPTSTTELVKTC